MKQPHFIKYGKRQPASNQPILPAAAEADGDSGEVVIRADAIFLGSSYPRRLRVVCFESPALGLARFTNR
ncbi:MAG TPA: hypothetical protein VG433_10495 [Pirellulales bacterium]|jgi:hypothetical protein|nr:hypothetical protein [Pirellulales bacterium]